MLAAAAAGVALTGCSSEEQPVSSAQPGPPPQREHQPGVVTPPEQFSTLLALDIAGPRAAAPLKLLAERIAKAQASVSVTLAAGASLFDDRFGLSGVRPAHLREMPSFPSDVLDPARCHGDLLLQVGATTADQAAAAAKDLTVDGLAVRWRQDAFRGENVLTAGGMPTTRNLFGFREGAGNPDPRDAALMERLVWAGDGEPGWAAGGTYQVVRLIRFATELWDRDAIPHQEAMIGRRRTDGTPLAGGPEDATFDYAADPDGQVTPLDAHIRRANPRTPESERTRILRRSYSYGKGDDQGLVFICFQRDPEAGFAAAQHRLTGEALQRYVLPFGGGYYFVPPSVAALAALTS